MPPDFSDKSRYTRVDPRLLANPPGPEVPPVDLVHKYGPMVIRGAGGLSPGGPIGAVVGGGSEYLAQRLENKNNPYSIAAAAALGAIPGGQQARILTALARGAGESALGTGLMQQTEGGLHVPTKDELEDIAISGAVGGVAGGALRGVVNRYGGKGVKIEEKPTIKIKEEPTVKGKSATPTVTVPTSVTPKVQDPNLHGGVGDPELAGSTKYAKGKSSKGVTKDKSKRVPLAEAEKVPMPVTATGAPLIPKEKGYVNPESPELIEASLPSSLAGAKPRYKTSELHFENDIDKALYTIANPKTKSTSHDKYMEFLVDATGMDEAAIRKGAVRLKREVGILADSGKAGEKVVIPRLNTFAKRVLAEAQDMEPTLSGPRVDLPDESMHHSSMPDIELSEANDMATPPVSLFQSGVRKVGDMLDPENKVRGWFKDNIPRTDEDKIDWPEVINVPKAFKASGDVSGALRQGIFLIGRKAWRDSIIPMVRSAKNVNYEKELQWLENHPKFDAAKEAGVRFGAIDSKGNRGEEAFGSALARKMPLGLGKLVSSSEQAYTTFLNRLRMQTFDEITGEAEKMFKELGPGAFKNGEIPYKTIAEYINTASGRGNIASHIGSKYKAGEKAAEFMNMGIFSPRFIASRIQLMNPATYVKLDPFTRKQYARDLKSMLTVVGGGATLAAASGADVHVNPFTDKDFGKAQIGPTRIDLTGGFGPYLRFAAAASRDMAGFSGDKESGPDLWRFIKSKQSPSLAMASELASGKDFFGKKQSRAMTIPNTFLPMIFKDLYDVSQNDPDPAHFGTAAASAIAGLPVSSYDDSSKSTGSGSGSSKGFRAKSTRKRYR